MNKNLLSNIIIFAAGAAVGSVVTWKLVKTKYEQIAQEEIESVREVYSGPQDAGDPNGDTGDPNGDTESDNDEESDRSDDRAAYSKIVNESGYGKDVNYHNFRPALDDSDYYGESDWPDDKDENDDEEEDDGDMHEPYIIPPEEFDENGYETVTLYHFTDGVLADAYSNEVLENPTEVVGDEFTTHYGEYEPDSVYVRNDALKTDYEILRDTRRFSEVE